MNNFEGNVNKTYQNMQNKMRFGSNMMNRCKSKELNMFIEKASNIVRELSAQREISKTSAIRTLSYSIDKKNSEISDTYPLVPSTRISLKKDDETFRQSFNSNIATHYRTKTVNVKNALQFSNFKFMTQKNSFIERQEPIVDSQAEIIKNSRNRGSMKTSVSRLSNLAKGLDQNTHVRYTSISEENPFEIASSKAWYSRSKNMKCTKNVHLSFKSDAVSKNLPINQLSPK